MSEMNPVCAFALASADDVTRSVIRYNPGLPANEVVSLFASVYRVVADYANKGAEPVSEPSVDVGSISAKVRVMAKDRAAPEQKRTVKKANVQALASWSTQSDAVTSPGESMSITELAKLLRPAVDPRESIVDGGMTIICLVDGARMTMLKRYIKRWGLTPDTYRAAFGLPGNYPMTAPGYSLQKSAEAKTLGLGTPSNKAGNKAPKVHEIALAA